MIHSQKRGLYRLLFFAGLLLLAVLVFLISTLGVAEISFAKSLRIILDKTPVIRMFVSDAGISNPQKIIVLQIRLPRILLSALVGMGLAVSGVVFQGIFRNPMADPFVLGISSGAALGATLAIILGLQATLLGTGAVSVAAFTGAIATTFTVYGISGFGRKSSTTTLLLAGIALSFFLSSVMSLLMSLNRDQLESIMFWTMGSFTAASWTKVVVCAPVILLGAVFLSLFSRDLNVIVTGEETAKTLGINVQKTKIVLLTAASIVAASAVSVSGIIGFVGLIIPHTVRLVLGPDHKQLFPFSMLAGAVFMILADTLARMLIPPMEIPVGIITSLFGAPFFIYLLRKRRQVLKG
jgi:iron complex transport system permease protein